MLVDSHCHLDFPEYKNEVESVVGRAVDNDVKFMQTICTQLIKFPQVLDVAKKFDNVFCSVGIHPNHVADEPITNAEKIIELTQDPNVIGIGETGLDYYYDYSSPEDQKISFKEHIKASQETSLPIIVHTRDADEDTLEILKTSMSEKEFPGLIHCFSTGRELAEGAIDLGMYVSISGIVTFKNAKDLQDIIKSLPLEKLLVETDAPFLAPVPHRGKTNEPAFTRHTAEFLAELKGVPYEEVAEVTTRNFFDLFSKAK